MKTANRIAALVVGLAAFAVLPVFLKSYGVYLCTLFCVTLMATYGLNLTVGYAGQMSLGQAAFYGIGAYIAAIALKAGVPFFVILPLAAVACFIVGLALGFPALRVQHHYLAFATLGFNVAMWLVMRNEEWLTGGTSGINDVGRPSVLGWSLSGGVAYYYFELAVAAALGALLWRLLRSPWGKAFTALRDNPIRAESLGIHVQAYTLLAFAIGAAYAGVAGALFAGLVQFVEPTPFSLGASFLMYLMVVVGGAGSFFGPALGAAVGVLLPEWLRFARGWYLVAFGVAVVLLMRWLPGGLLSIPDRLRTRRARVTAANRGRT
jgi:branched-chain amino acid transport system permease protein